MGICYLPEGCSSQLSWLLCLCHHQFMWKITTKNSLIVFFISVTASVLWTVLKYSWVPCGVLLLHHKPKECFWTFIPQALHHPIMNRIKNLVPKRILYTNLAGAGHWGQVLLQSTISTTTDLGWVNWHFSEEHFFNHFWSKHSKLTW